MNIRTYFKTLKMIGMTSREADLYLASLFLGPASIIELSNKVKLSRQMIYIIIPSMLEKGFLKKVTIGKKIKYEAVDPDLLKIRADEIHQKVNRLVPELKTKQVVNKAIPLISIYDSPKGMREWYKKFMDEAKKDEKILIWSAGKSWYKMDAKFYQKYLDFKDKKEILDYVIGPDKKESRMLYQKIKSKNRKYRYFKKWWAANSEIWIWRNQICYLTLREKATNLIVVESEELAKIERFNFWKVWKFAKR